MTKKSTPDYIYNCSTGSEEELSEKQGNVHQTISLSSPTRNTRRGRPQRYPHSNELPSNVTPDETSRLQEQLSLAEEKIKQLNLTLSRTRVQLSRTASINARRRVRL